jgi:sugar transferase (PEP-CTERM/EpsH1 system associated)
MVKSLAYDLFHPRFKKLWSAAALLKSAPISISYFYSNKIQRAVDALLRRHQFDALFGFSSPMAEYLFRSFNSRFKPHRPLWVMDLVDVDSYKWRQLSWRHRGVKRWIYHREAQHLAAYEKKIVEKFDQVLLTSEQEKELFPKTVPADKVTVMANGVDLDYFSPAFCKKGREQGSMLVFTGVMDYPPNADGVIWFVREIFPRIRSVISGATFYIVGSRPGRDVRRLARTEGVRVTGHVEDIRDFMSEADVCVVPLLIARGVQNKVMEAFAMGKPVVCTPHSLEGISAASGKDVVVAEDGESFAESVVRLLKAPALREQLGHNARRFVETNCSWDRHLSVLDRILKEDGVDGDWNRTCANL